jgi:cyclopropane-fatty-acyl-phospholipid synthase
MFTEDDGLSKGLPAARAHGAGQAGKARSRAQAIVTGIFAAAGIHINGQQPWDITIHDERFYRRLLAAGTLGLGESYMEGWWDCVSLDEMFFRAIQARLEERVPIRFRDLIAITAALIVNAQTRRRAPLVGERHYDLGNDFFGAMLDPAMQYSCAYFHETDDLAVAQRLKLDLICRKLGLSAGMRLLDIGCGWGGLAKYAAENYGCSVVGITISTQQQQFAEKFCAGLSVEIRLQDYRDVKDRFDRVVSVGMVEHVGFKNYRRYMRSVFRCLPDGGLFLCQAVGTPEWRVHCDPWIGRYIFPNSLPVSASRLTRAAEGLFILEDVHNFGAFYDRTLLAWEANVRRSWDRFEESCGSTFYRMWRYYLLSCAGAFRARTLDLFQFVFSKGGLLGGYQSLR